MIVIEPIVKHDVDIGKYNNTQEVFLGKVGIQNSYSEDNEHMIEPFFVSAKPIASLNLICLCLGESRCIIHIYKAQPVVFCVYFNEAKSEASLRTGAAETNRTGRHFSRNWCDFE